MSELFTCCLCKKMPTKDSLYKCMEFMHKYCSECFMLLNSRYEGDLINGATCVVCGITGSFDVWIQDVNELIQNEKAPSLTDEAPLIDKSYETSVLEKAYRLLNAPPEKAGPSAPRYLYSQDGAGPSSAGAGPSAGPSSAGAGPSRAGMPEPMRFDACSDFEDFETMQYSSSYPFRSSQSPVSDLKTTCLSPIPSVSYSVTRDSDEPNSQDLDVYDVEAMDSVCEGMDIPPKMYEHSSTSSPHTESQTIRISSDEEIEAIEAIPGPSTAIPKIRRSKDKLCPRLRAIADTISSFSSPGALQTVSSDSESDDDMTSEASSSVYDLMRCPDRFCRKIVAASEYESHVKFDHDQTPKFGIERGEELNVQFSNIALVEHNRSLMIAMISVIECKQIEINYGTFTEIEERHELETFYLMVSGSTNKHEPIRRVFWLFNPNEEKSFYCTIKLCSQYDTVYEAVQCNVYNNYKMLRYEDIAMTFQGLVVHRSRLRALMQEGPRLHLRITIH